MTYQQAQAIHTEVSSNQEEGVTPRDAERVASLHLGVESWEVREALDFIHEASQHEAGELAFRIHS